MFGIRAGAQTHKLSGFVGDGESLLALSGCTVQLAATKIASHTDQKGYFELLVPDTGRHAVIVTHSGYQPDTVYGRVASAFQIWLHVSTARLAEVVITGFSKAVLLRENPIAITGVSSKKIDASIDANIIDVLVKHVPGLNAVKTGPNISKPVIRGLGYNRVLTLYDGLRQEGQQWGDEHGLEADAYNIERAEVIKGPASLMFGSDALAGVVSLFPSLPKEKDGRLHGRMVSEYQTNNGLVGQGFRIGYRNKSWLLMIRGSNRMAKNYQNAIDGRVFNSGFHETNLSATAGYESSHGRSHLNLTVYNNRQGIPDGSRDSLTRQFTQQVLEGMADDVTTRPLVTPQVLNSYALTNLHQHIQHYRIYTTNHYNFGQSTLDMNIGLQQNSRKEYSHPTAPAQPGLSVTLNTLNYDVKYLLPPVLTMEITAGLNGMFQVNKSKQATDFPVPDYHLLDAGGWIHMKWKYQRLTFSGGARYDVRHITVNDFYTRRNPQHGFNEKVNIPDTASAYLQFSAFSKRFGGISLSAGLTYQLFDHWSIKANIARGYRSPNITEFAANGLDPGAHIVYLGNRNFMPEFSLEEDLGVTADFTSLKGSVSIFHNHIRNYIYLTQLANSQGLPETDAQGNRSFQYLQSAARLYGAEASVEMHPRFLPGLTFTNGLSLTYGLNTNIAYSGKGNQGEYLPLIPPLKWLSLLTKEFIVNRKCMDGFSFGAEIEYNATQQRYLALFNTETPTPAYALAGCMAGMRWRASTIMFHLQLQVANLFDKAYQSHLSRLKYFEYYNTAANGHMGLFNAGRSINIKLMADF